jgi:hypothetical protein
LRHRLAGRIKNALSSGAKPQRMRLPWTIMDDANSMIANLFFDRPPIRSHGLGLSRLINVLGLHWQRNGNG